MTVLVNVVIAADGVMLAVVQIVIRAVIKDQLGLAVVILVRHRVRIVRFEHCMLLGLCLLVLLHHQMILT